MVMISGVVVKINFDDHLRLDINSVKLMVTDICSEVATETCFLIVLLERYLLPARCYIW